MLTVQQVGRFEIRDFLGRGAMGDVHLAWDPQESREVALKVIRAKHADPEMLEAEKNGVSLQRQLSEVAPQVAAVFEWGEDSGFFWVAMEYVPGTDLAQMIQRGPLPEDHATFISHQLCEMLEACHQFSGEIGGRKVYGVVHGDIKPENLRIQEGERVRVLDFGIAKHLSQTRRFTVNLFGSLPYTPPERLEKGGVDRHSDLWAVGVVLYLMVAGYSPFSGDDPEELEGKIRSGEPPRPLPDDVSPGLKKIIRKSLSFDAARRYPSAVELKADLEAWNEGKPLPSEAQEPAPSPAEDLNATRRTVRPGLDDSGSFQSSETRRTDRAAVVVPPPPPAAPVAVAAVAEVEPPPAPRPTGRRRLRLQSMGVLLLLAGSLMLASQVWVQSEASEIRRDLVTDTSPDLDGLWSRYQKIEAFSLPTSEVREVRTELREALLRSGERILESYRGDSPTTTERGWQKAHNHLKAALDLQFRDKPTRAKMIYAKAHLDRIESQTLRGRGQRDPARQKVREAAEEFRDAAKLAPDWPDPYLGLARIYAYEQFDLKQLEEALSELERRGYPMGRREKAMLADGYRMRAQELLAQATRARDTDQEQETELLETSRDHFTQAIELYREAGSFANARGNMADSAKQLQGILWRLEELGIW